MFKTSFLDRQQALRLTQEHGSPLFVYAKPKLIKQAQAMLRVPAPFGLTIRYAMKANPHPGILQTFYEAGVKIDASSAYEITLAREQGFEPQDILLTSQQLAVNLEELVATGVQFNATSLHQLEQYAKLFPGTSVGVRLNPGIGSGHSAKTNVGGRTSSFGIWFEYLPKIHELAKKYDLQISRMHTHIGAGTDPVVWQQAAQLSLDLIKEFPDASIINLGGGFKVARMDDEHEADMNIIGRSIGEELQRFKDETGRELHLELEPGTFLVANAGILLAQVDDLVDTGEEGYSFMKLNTGMNDILRPALYGAQHPIAVLNEQQAMKDYVVVGHNCESGDLLTPAPGDPDSLLPRRLHEAAIGDLVAIGGTGAYCAGMSAHGYNSFPNAQEILIS
jgi:diaminopimelate decarboxylase